MAQSSETGCAIQGVGKPPGEHMAAVPVEDSDLVHETSQQRHIGDVCAPELVDMPNREIAQEIGIDLMAFIWCAALFLGIDRLNTHLRHQEWQPLAIYGVPLSSQIGGHLGPAIEGRGQILLVNKAHQMQIQR